MRLGCSGAIFILFYRALQRNNTVFSDVVATFSLINVVHGTVDGREKSEPMNVQLVAGTYFSMLGVRPYIYGTHAHG
jgi:hypothetical protein